MGEPHSLEELKRIQLYIAHHTGLRHDRISKADWSRAIANRMRRLGIHHLVDYCLRLERSRAECAELVEGLVVTETWFFRERKAIDALVQAVREATESGSHPSPWRILSTACSTGEEPYSIAMALLSQGVDPLRFHVIGLDISRRVLEKAELGFYTSNSFRSKELDFRSVYFTECEGGYQLKDQVRRLVRFRWANLVDPWLFLGGQRFDAIYCRNVLMYLTPEAQLKALSHCRKLLEPGGVLFVGPTEAELVKSVGFVAVDEGKAGAFSIPVARMALHVLSPTQDPLQSDEMQAERDAMLVKAQQLADEGNRDDAILACHRYISLYGGSAGVYFLLGILEVAGRRDDNAEQFFKKVIYLEPAHYEGLVNLALIAERRGEMQDAQRYWKRVRKVAT